MGELYREQGIIDVKSWWPVGTGMELVGKELLSVCWTLDKPMVENILNYPVHKIQIVMYAKKQHVSW